MLANADPKVRKAVELLKMTRMALRIITIALVNDDSDFFASYENYVSIASMFGKFGISTGDGITDSSGFNKVPTTSWVVLISLLFGVLNGYGDDGGVTVVTASTQGTSDCLGYIMSVNVSTFDVDEKTHKLSLVLDVEKRNFITLDDEPMLF